MRAARMQSQGAFDPLRDDARLRSLRAAAEADPDNALVRLQLAQRYEGYGLFAQAMDEYASLLKIVSRSAGTAEDRPLLASTLSGIARSGFASDRAGEAVSILASYDTDERGAFSSELHMYTGLLYAHLGDQPRAEASFRAAVRSNPQSAAARNNLGYQLMKRGLLAEAEMQFREAIGTDNGSRFARNNLGLLLTERGDLESAWKQFAAADSDVAAARNNFAVALMNSGKLLESREQLIIALRERRGYAAALQNFQVVQGRIKESQARSGAAKPQEYGGSAAAMSRVPNTIFSGE